MLTWQSPVLQCESLLSFLTCFSLIDTWWKSVVVCFKTQMFSVRELFRKNDSLRNRRCFLKEFPANSGWWEASVLLWVTAEERSSLLSFPSLLLRNRVCVCVEAALCQHVSNSPQSSTSIVVSHFKQIMIILCSCLGAGQRVTARTLWWDHAGGQWIWFWCPHSFNG